MQKMNPQNKKIIYDGINMSVKALTFFILIGLVIMACLIWYGATRGAAGTSQESSPNLPQEQSYTKLPEGISRGALKDCCLAKINQKFIDKRELSYYNKTIVVTAKTP